MSSSSDTTPHGPPLQVWAPFTLGAVVLRAIVVYLLLVICLELPRLAEIGGPTFTDLWRVRWDGRILGWLLLLVVAASLLISGMSAQVLRILRRGSDRPGRRTLLVSLASLALGAVVLFPLVHVAGLRGLEEFVLAPLLESAPRSGWSRGEIAAAFLFHYLGLGLIAGGLQAVLGVFLRWAARGTGWVRPRLGVMVRAGTPLLVPALLLSVALPILRGLYGETGHPGANSVGILLMVDLLLVLVHFHGASEDARLPEPDRSRASPGWSGPVAATIRSGLVMLALFAFLAIPLEDYRRRDEGLWERGLRGALFRHIPSRTDRTLRVLAREGGLRPESLELSVGPRGIRSLYDSEGPELPWLKDLRLEMHPVQTTSSLGKTLQRLTGLERLHVRVPRPPFGMPVEEWSGQVRLDLFDEGMRGRLRSLGLEALRVHPRSWEVLEDFAALEELLLYPMPRGEGPRAKLAALPALRRLTLGIDDPAQVPEVARTVAALPALRTLRVRLYGSWPRGEPTRGLLPSSSPGLEEVGLGALVLDRTSVHEILAALPDLREFELFRPHFLPTTDAPPALGHPGVTRLVLREPTGPIRVPGPPLRLELENWPALRELVVSDPELLAEGWLDEAAAREPLDILLEFQRSEAYRLASRGGVLYLSRDSARAEDSDLLLEFEEVLPLLGDPLVKIDPTRVCRPGEDDEARVPVESISIRALEGGLPEGALASLSEVSSLRHLALEPKNGETSLPPELATLDQLTRLTLDATPYGGSSQLTELYLPSDLSMLEFECQEPHPEVFEELARAPLEILQVDAQTLRKAPADFAPAAKTMVLREDHRFPEGLKIPSTVETLWIVGDPDGENCDRLTWADDARLQRVHVWKVFPIPLEMRAIDRVRALERAAEGVEECLADASVEVIRHELGERFSPKVVLAGR